MHRIKRLTTCVITITLLFNVFSLPVYAKQPVSSDSPVSSLENTEDTNVINTEENETTGETVSQPLEDTGVDTTEIGETENDSVVFNGSNTPLNDRKDLTLTDVGITVNDNTIMIYSGEELIKLSHVDPVYYKDKTLRFVNNKSSYDTTTKVNITVGGETADCTFIGLDDFEGTISVAKGTENYPIKLVSPLFNSISDNAIIKTDDDSSGLLLMFVAKTSDTSDNGDNPIPSALLAETVTASGSSPSTPWNIRILASDSDGTTPPLIGTVTSNAIVSLSVDTSKPNISNMYSVTQVKRTGNAGLLCAQMESGANLTLSSLKTEKNCLPSVTASSGDAGSLIGKMGSGSTLKFDSGINSLMLSNVSASSGNAGGLVGSATDAILPQIAVKGSDSSKIEGNSSKIEIKGLNAGGLVGDYAFSGKQFLVSSSVSNITISGVSNTTSNAGGVFGVLKNTGTGKTEFNNLVSVDVTLSAKNDVGGLIGRYSASNLDATLQLNPRSIQSSVSGTPSSYGGLIGWVDGSNAASYIEIEPVGTVTVNGTANNYGGLIGSLSDKGHYVKVGTVTVNNTDTIKGNTTAGGLVGQFYSGVLELDGKVTAPTPSCGNSCYRGNYVGQRENALIYTTFKPDGGWKFNVDGNDIGNWGQVIQVYDELENLLTIENHTVTVTEMDANGIVNGLLPFAQIALRFQLDSIGALSISNDLNLNDVTLSLSGTINLSGTGLTGFQRDDSKAAKANVTLNCTNAEIIFPGITFFGGASNIDNVSHTRQGLFSEINGLTVKNDDNSKLKLSGSITVNAFEKYVFLGALVAESYGNVNAQNVICTTDLSISSSFSQERISGLVAQQNGGEVSFTGCEWKSTINYTGNNTCYLGGFLARAENGNGITVQNSTIGGTITKSGTGESFVGGLVASLRDNVNGNWTNSLNIDGLTADGVTIDTQNSSKTGGILGWEWMTKTTDIQGITVENCTLNSGSARFGGLVYKGSGYWQLKGNGIRFVSNNKFEGSPSNDSPSGLLVADGSKQADHYNALYLEISENAYTITKDSVSLNISESTPFDEIVGLTEGDLGNGIVSIGTRKDTNNLTANDCNYTKQLAQNYDNSKTRYYYNLHVFRNGNAGSGDIDSPGKLVLYSAYTHCYERLRQYFYNNPGNITGTLDLTGYSYYPAEEVKTIKNAAITFDFVNLKNNSLSPGNNNCQNYGMHTGIFTDIINSSEVKMECIVNDLTLKGTVGGSAIINGIVRGNSSTAMTSLDITNVKLDGIRAALGDGRPIPLLINSIESFTSMKLTDVTTTDSYNDLGDKYAATSLIGKAGQTNGDTQVGQYIQLDFSLIALDGRISSDGNNTTVNNTKRSIFSTALFLQEFQYIDSNSWGIYNFSQTDEQKGNNYYTLGKELSNTDGTTNVRNGGEQFYFYGTEDYVYCVVKRIENSTGKDDEAGQYFISNYRPYVNNEESSSYHQMDINLSSKDIIDGCGTYSDPYIIEYGKQLSSVAKVLNGESPKKNWKITLNTTVLSAGFSNQDGHTNSNLDIVFTWNGSEWECDGQTSLTNNKVIEYLSNAYYLLKNTKTEESEGNGGVINLTSNWGGLGSSSNPFQGVIVGEQDVTVHINVNNGSQFGGLIAYSTGSVVKNVNIQYDHAPSIACTSAPNSIDAPFFGGVVGWCIGGDTIIDGVTVRYSPGAVPTTTAIMAYLVPVGGYVGLIGGTEGLNNTTDGKGGGVVFRGTNSSSLSSVSVGGTSVTPSDENSNYFYVNPFVGRVLDGYALGEGITVENTDKNYTIPNISHAENENWGISFNETADTIQIANGQGLWLLSAVVNSGANDTTPNGKSRLCNYDSVGEYLPDNLLLDETSSSSAYLIRKFNLELLKNRINAGAVKIELTGDCDMTSFRNGFRGIGGSYGSISSVGRLLNVSSISSFETNKFTITLEQSRKEYTKEAQSWTSLGAGLFPVLNPANSFTAERFILAGKAGISYYSSDLEETVNPIPGDKKLMDVGGYRLGCSGAGLLAGTMKKSTGKDSTIALSNIKITGSVTGSATFAGGLIGLACINTLKSDGYIYGITVDNCNYQQSSVEGFACVGGFFGYVYANTVSIIADADYPMNTISIKSSNTKVEGAKTGIGALIGRCGVTNLTIKSNDSAKAMIFSGTHKIFNQNNSTSSDKYFSGGLVGLLGLEDNSNVIIQNIEFTDKVEISNYNSINTSGVLAGALTRYVRSNLFDNGEFSWSTSSGIKTTISNIKIASKANDSVIVKNTKQGGTLFGWLKANAATISEIQIGSDNAEVIMATENEQDASSLSGLIGTVSKATITINDTIFNRINVWGLSKNNARGSALFVGFADNGAVINIRNAKITDCNVTVHKTYANAGMIYAHLGSASVNGYNILVDGCTLGLSLNSSKSGLTAFTTETGSPDRIGLVKGSTYKPYLEIQSEIKDYSASATNIALFGGKVQESKNVKLVGVSIQNCNTPMKDFGTGQGSDSYVIRADYAGSSKEEPHNAINASSPYVTVNPLSSLVIPDQTITGDGAVFSNGTSTPLLKSILDEDKYYNIQTYSKNYLKKMNGNSENFESSENSVIAVGSFKNSDLNTFGDNDEQPNDFPVIVLQTNSSDEANRCLHSIISVLTNWELCTDANGTITSGTKGFNSVTATSYIWNENDKSFDNQNSIKSLYVKENRFYLKPGGYDNKLKQFTLVDVTYNDPATNSKDAFHLYIPVVVKKMFEYKFSASANLSTTYNVSSYDGLSQPVIASHGEPVTVLLNYEYQWTKDEWEDAMKNGQNLLWNFDLGVTLNPYTVPAGTQMTLVDRNYDNQAYFMSPENETNEISFKDFKKEGISWNTDRYLCDDLKLTANQDNNGSYYLLEDSNDATLRDVEGKYYKPATDSDTVGNRYNLNISNIGDSGKITVQFYLTLSTLSDATGIINTNVECSDSLSGNLPTRRLRVNNDHDFTKNGNENKLILGNFFTQESSVTTTRGEEKITEINAEIPLELSTTISFVDGSETIYKEYASGQRLYQKFVLKLREYSEDDKYKAKELVIGTRINIQYYLGGNPIGDPINDTLQSAVYSYPLEFRWTDGELGIPAQSVKNNMQLKAVVSLSYQTASILIEQFPIRSSETSKAGIAVVANSTLAYNANSLHNNTNHGSDIEAKCGELSPHFYREDIGAASLNYVAYEKQNDTPAESVSELGINGRDGSNFVIHSAALYNVSGVNNAENADTLKVTVSLLQKQAGSTYQNLNYQEVTDLQKYISSLEVKAYYKQGSDMKEATLTNNSTYEFSLKNYDSEVPVQIPVTLSVRTGEGYEEAYANYRIKVTAQLMKDGSPIENSIATDYIVYTNAKISQFFLDINP